MSFFVDSVLYPTATVFVVAIVAVVIYFKYYAFKFWENRYVPFKDPVIPTGNITSALIGRKTLGKVVEELYKEFKEKKYMHAGIYFLNSPIYMPLDPDIIKNILMKDFSSFVDRGVYYNETNEPLSAHLFAIEGAKWRSLRNKLSPTFTSGKMKMMFQTLVDCSDGLKDLCEEVVAKDAEVDIKDVFARFTTDIIGSCAFGLECNSLKNPDAEFRKMGRRIFEQTTWEAVKTFIGLSFPALAATLNLRLFDENASNFFMKAVKDTVDFRESKNIKRNDFLQLLIQLKNGRTDDGESNNGLPENKSVGTSITFNEAAAQAFVFFLAGFETSSTTGTFCLYELATNKAIQDKLRAEVQTVLKEYNGKLTYEAIMKMTYMDKVIQEALRKYPPVPFLVRKCTAEKYKIPNSKLVLEKGQLIFIPAFGLHMDPEYYPDPEKFDPERFSDENKSKRHPCVHLPFGEGPRICIGLRFGMMQTKVGLAVLLSRYQVSLNEKTKLPIVFDPKSIILTALGGIWLNVKKIKT